MARAISMGSAVFVGVRVAGAPTYIPAHLQNGKPVSQRAVIPVYMNSNRGTNQDGSQGRSDTYNLVCWGKMADICAVSLPPGKAIDVFCTPNSYLGRLYNPDGTTRLDNSGRVIETRKVSFTINRIIFGEESEKTIQADLQAGIRGQNWNVRGTQDYQNWVAVLKQRQATRWDGRSPMFGYARVSVPAGAQLIDPNTIANARAQYAQNNAAAPANTGGFQTNTGGFQTNVRSGGFNASTGFAAPRTDGNQGFQGANQAVGGTGRLF